MSDEARRVNHDSNEAFGSLKAEIAELRAKLEEQRQRRMIADDELRLARGDIAELEARVAQLEAALQWALPLAELALEEHRQVRLKAGHSDIGGGTDHVGLWPDEVRQRARAREALAPRPAEAEERT